jgi:hypothetical protein
MAARWLLLNLMLGVACAAGLLGQQTPSSGLASNAQEFPVVLLQNVTAGKTPVGTKVQAKLAIATLFNGIVIPRNAVFSGEIVESVAKTSQSHARLAIRMDSITWKDGTASIKASMTPWYYPTESESGQDLQYGPPQSPTRTWNGAGAYPDPNLRGYKPFPDAGSDKDPSAPNTPASVTSKRRAPMKNVEADRNSDGTVALVSKNGNIKLDRLTTYILAADVTPQK